ncbi:hypothetical protein M406DRAFT_354277 [Cryphonectria parasitica EP155]|uniref:Uncharacterized protein n=1 Tax=Cryphonectria parasitica (strain ATCC 38755 / EP155) TaxID=660469 RepID=A0A9P4YB68_CRYP1|nr:uncharacterized protein M406DRAFT_354277 [Cryphonectria parasitica EP155]KAF3770131.1 hypothetical protein M406DRAFT_354277 [Cryphonectria parasitica EP155]
MDVRIGGTQRSVRCVSPLCLQVGMQMWIVGVDCGCGGEEGREAGPGVFACVHGGTTRNHNHSQPRWISSTPGYNSLLRLPACER